MANGKGGRDIYLAGNGGSKEEQLLAGVLLQHEAYRDGVVGSELEQVEETEAAVIGHTLMADRMRHDYGYGAFVGTEIMGDLAALYGGGEAGISGRAGGYDSSADYWKLTTDGRLLNDNKADLYLADAEGNYIYENGKRVKLVDTETRSVSQSLIQYIGMDRASELLGVNPADMSNYNEQTLQDVLGMSSDMGCKTLCKRTIFFW
ncbi:hypothetical protein [Sediminispirochaeta bajacaliforniensis]|uniref:hypothetical protein n=1 Tax=Sediminispirochaeta bajacaliforniensis TaxID=148 RepID=UPI000382DD63|nr:hypothetical protein [Sediminispirochaeta bajacaliforniensis]